MGESPSGPDAPCIYAECLGHRGGPLTGSGRCQLLGSPGWQPVDVSRLEIPDTSSHKTGPGALTMGPGALGVLKTSGATSPLDSWKTCFSVGPVAVWFGDALRASTLPDKHHWF